MPSRKRKGQSEEDMIFQKLVEILRKTISDKPLKQQFIVGIYKCHQNDTIKFVIVIIIRSRFRYILYYDVLAIYRSNTIGKFYLLSNSSAISMNE